MKVLIITNMRPSVQQPFAGIFVINQYMELKKLMGDNIELYTMERSFTGALGSIIKYLKAFIRFIPFCFRKFDIIHVHFFYPFIILAVFYRLFNPSSRIVVTFHGNDVIMHMKSRLNRFLYGRMARMANYSIAVGQDLAEETKEKLGFFPNLVMCAGVDKKVFYPEPGTEKRYDILFVGTFIHRKGVDLLIEAIRLLGRRDIRICMAGSGVYKDDIVRLSEEYPVEIREKMTQPELRTLYSQARFFVMTSRSEAFGLVVTEALYCGLPAIVSDIGGLKDQVKDGYNGYILGDLNAMSLKELLSKALNMPEKDYRIMAGNAAASNESFSLDYVIHKTMDIYKSLAAEKVAAL